MAIREGNGYCHFHVALRAVFRPGAHSPGAFYLWLPFGFRYAAIFTMCSSEFAAGAG